MAAIVAASALTPVMASAAENDTVAPGVYNTSTNETLTLAQFQDLSTSAKGKWLSNSNVYVVVDGLAYKGTNIITLSEDALLASGVPAADVVTPGQTSDLKVESVSAINATTVEVKIATAVDAADAEGSTTPSNTANLAKYSIDGNNPTKVELSEDGKTATLTFATSVEGENLAVVVEPITTKADDNVKTERYAGTLTYKDTVKPTVTKIESITGGDQATSATVTFSEPVDLTNSTVKLNGTEVTSADYSLSADGLELEITGQNMDATKEQTLEFVNLADNATVANITSYIKETFKPVVDKVTPTVTAVEAKSDTALVFTFSKKVAINNTAQADTYIQLFDADLADQTSTLLSTNTFSEVAGSNGTKWEVNLAATPFAANAKTADLTVKVLDKTIADPQGNKIAQVLKNVKITKDETAPKVTDAKYRTDAEGKVKELVFTFAEDITLVSNSALTDLLSDTSVNVENSVADDLKAVFGGTLPAGTFAVKDNVITFALTTPQNVSGKYNLEVAANTVADKSLATNANKAHAFTLDFGAAKEDETFEISSASATSTNVIEVNFDTAVKGGTSAGSATLLSAYQLNGQALPVGTTITLNAAQTKATITLPEGTIKDTDTAAIFVADSIVSKDGKKNLEKYTGTVSIGDNVAPVLTGVSLTADNNLLVTFSESVTADVDDLEISINGTVADNSTDGLTITPGTGSDAGKYIINLADLIQYDDNSSGKTEIVLSNGNIEIANSDVTSTFKFATSSVIDSIKVKVVGDTTVDAAGNELVQDTEITVK